MKRFRVQKVLKVALCVVVAATVAALVVRGLWNVLMPEIFGLRTLTFWQSLGLLVLTKLLFGGFHRHSSSGCRGWKGRMRERLEAMTPEEREKFSEAMRHGGRPFGRTVQS